jgi:hypothetical protein
MFKKDFIIKLTQENSQLFKHNTISPSTYRTYLEVTTGSIHKIRYYQMNLD